MRTRPSPRTSTYELHVRASRCVLSSSLGGHNEHTPTGYLAQRVFPHLGCVHLRTRSPDSEADRAVRSGAWVMPAARSCQPAASARRSPGAAGAGEALAQALVVDLARGERSFRIGPAVEGVQVSLLWDGTAVG